jgi:hypothetical protein
MEKTVISIQKNLKEAPDGIRDKCMLSSIRASGTRGINVFADLYPTTFLRDTIVSEVLVKKRKLSLVEINAPLKPFTVGESSQNTFRRIRFYFQCNLPIIFRNNVFLIILVFVNYLICVELIVKKSHLSHKYSYLGIGCFAILLIPMFFSNFMDKILIVMEFTIPTNGINAISTVFLSFVFLNLSIQLTVHESQLGSLVSKIAIEKASDNPHD